MPSQDFLEGREYGDVAGLVISDAESIIDSGDRRGTFMQFRASLERNFNRLKELYIRHYGEEKEELYEAARDKYMLARQLAGVESS